MENKDNPYLKDDGKSRHVLRTVGWVTLCVGVSLLLIGGFSFVFVGVAGSFPILSMILFSLGGTSIMVGSVCLFLGYMKKINHYMASQSTPVASESANYILNDTRDEVKKTADAIKGTETSVICPHCGAKNEPGASYCDHCGTKLSKVCPKCGEINDADSDYCRKCGAHL